MGQKDLAAKQFERSPEVFADIVNALIFEGEQVVSPNDLQPAPTESLYPAAHGILRNQYNDVSKYEIRNGRIVVQYTLENQSRPDFINNIESLQKRQKGGDRVTMCEVVDKFVARGREQGIKEGIKEEKTRCAEAFVKESVLQNQPKEYITGILQTCFQLKEEEADKLYREGYESERETEIPAFT